MNKTLKKVLTLGLVTASVFGLSGCGNKDYGDWAKKTFNKVHLVSKNKCYSIKSWSDYDSDSISVTLDDGTYILGNTMELVLINGTCPYCGK